MGNVTRVRLEKIKNKIRKEFPDDEMMYELHLIRAIHNEETRNMDIDGKVDEMNKEAEEIMRRMGYRLAPTGKGTYRIQEISARQKKANVS